MVGHTVSFFMAVAFQCTPIASNWNKSITGHCVDQNAMAYAGAGLSIFEDFFIMLLPIWVLKDLQLSVKKRVSLCFIFAMGSLSVIPCLRFRPGRCLWSRTDMTQRVCYKHDEAEIPRHLWQVSGYDMG